MDFDRLQLTRATKLLEAAKTVVILAPDTQDPDSVSSNLALKITLESQGKIVRWFASSGSSPYFAYMRGNDQCEDIHKLDLKPSQVDVVVLTDAGSIDQFECSLKSNRWLIDACPTVLFDHHAVRGGSSFTAEVIGHAAATGELLFYVYNELGWEITPDIAQLMMIGLQADTDTFSNLGVGANAFRVAADLIERGADAGIIAEEIKESNHVNPASFYKFNRAIAQTKFDGPIAYSVLTKKEAADIGAEADPCHYIVSTIRFIKGVKMSFVLQELEHGVYRLSMRSRHGYRAANVAQHFGGGGHSFMAGATIKSDKPAQEIALEVAALAKQEVEKSYAKSI